MLMCGKPLQFLLLISFVSTSGCINFAGECETKVGRRVFSPDRTLQAFSFTTDCGATTTPSYGVRIIEGDDSTEVGSRESTVLGSNTGVRLKWLSRDTLLITGADTTSGYTMLHNLKIGKDSITVSIVYSDLIDTAHHDINAFSRIFSDTTQFVALGCGLYRNERGVLGFQTINNSDGKTRLIYLTTIYGADPTDSINGGQKEMRYVVDTSTFKILSAFYLRDKNHIYNFNPMHDGGTIAINEVIDKNSLQVLDGGCYAKDKKHCFYRGTIIKGADRKSFKVLDADFSCYIAYDKNYYYENEDKMSATDIKELNLDSIRYAQVSRK